MIAGAILAGGQSTRMGQPKEGVVLSDGRPMIEHVADAYRGVCEQIVIVGACEGYDIASCKNTRQVKDRHKGVGPLGGVEALLASGIASAYVVTSCDQPLLTPDLLRLLVQCGESDGVFLRTDDGVELDPFPGFFPAAWLCGVENAIREKRLGVRRFLRTMDVQWVRAPANAADRVRSFNRPDELRNL